MPQPESPKTPEPATLSSRPQCSVRERWFDVGLIYVEKDALAYPRAHEILSAFPDATQIPVDAHNTIPGLYGNEGNVRDWIKTKRTTLVLGVKKTLSARPNTRSADFIAPSHASGCAAACAYCYVPRNKGYANPVTTFVNIEKITGYLARHAKRQGQKPQANEADPHLWTYDIGENSDCSGDAALSDNVKDLVHLFRTLPNAKATFATKFVNRDLLTYDPQGHTRIRFSLMPAPMAKLLDVRTSPIAQRIAAINDFVEAGYEVHLNFSPIIIAPGYLDAYATLFDQIDAALSARARAQLACEIIFLTHNEPLHEINVVWHPRAEQVLWRPDLQEPKISENGMRNVRYKFGLKSREVRAFCDLLARKLPYCRIRYAF